MKKILYGLISSIIVFFFATSGYARNLFVYFSVRQIKNSFKSQFADAEVWGMTFDNTHFTVEGRDKETKLYARFVCHFRCTQTDLYVEEGGKGSFIQKTTENTARLETAGKP